METARETVNLAIKLAEKLEQRYSVVITADHGHVPVEGVVKLDKDLLNYVDLPPYGDHRNLMFMSILQITYPHLVLSHSTGRS